MRRFLAFLAVPILALACSGTTTTVAGGDGGSSNDAASDAPHAGGGGGGGSGGGGAGGGGGGVAGGGGGGGAAGGGGGSGGGECDGGACSFGLQCCGTACVNETNDPNNCGGCGIVCSGSTSMCLGSQCRAPTCSPPCGAGYECCDIQGPGPSGPPRCVQGTTCPVGCPLCG